MTLSSTNVVGNGSLSGPGYIHFSPVTLSQTQVTQTVVATLEQFGTGPSGYEYLVDELAFACNSVVAGTVLALTVSATYSSSAKWVAMEMSTAANDPWVNPILGTKCDASGGGLYLPYGAVASSYSTTSGGKAVYTGGNTYVFSANQTSGTPGLTDDSCTENAAPTQTTIPSITIATTESTLTDFYYFTFVVTGANAGIGITNPAFTFSFS